MPGDISLKCSEYNLFLHNINFIFTLKLSTFGVQLPICIEFHVHSSREARDALMMDSNATVKGKLFGENFKCDLQFIEDKIGPMLKGLNCTVEHKQSTSNSTTG
jgi:hypothetical protein